MLGLAGILLQLHRDKRFIQQHTIVERQLKPSRNIIRTSWKHGTIYWELILLYFAKGNQRTNNSTNRTVVASTSGVPL
nr:unnamed protein product [Callosobruchus analis]